MDRERKLLYLVAVLAVINETLTLAQMYTPYEPIQEHLIDKA